LGPFGRARIGKRAVRAAAGPAGAAASRRPTTSQHAATADPGPGRDIRRENATNLAGIFLRQIDLVLTAVDRKLHGLVSLTAVEVVHQDVDGSLGHEYSPLKTTDTLVVKKITQLPGVPSTGMEKLLGPHQRKEDCLPNTEAGQRHEQAVDSHAHTPGWRHSVLHRT